MLRFHCTITTISLIIFLFAVNVATAIGKLGKGEVIFDSKADVEYDSNVSANSDEISDLIGSINVGIAFEQLERSVANVMARAGVEAIRYVDLKEFDAENLFLDLDFSYPNNQESNAYYELGVNWSETTRSNFQVGQIIESEELGISGSYRAYLNEKSGFRMSSELGQSSFTDSNLSDSDDISFTVDYLYRYSSKLNLVTGYRYRELENRGGAGSVSISQSSHTFDIGVDGELRPKVEGTISFGIQFLDSSGSIALADGTNFYYDIGLAWRANSRTSVSLSGSGDFQNSPNGGVNNRRDIAMRLTQRSRSRSSRSIGLTYAQSNFSGLNSRKDDSITLNSRYQHNLSKNKNLGLSADYEIRESNNDFFSYDRFRLALDFQVSF